MRILLSGANGYIGMRLLPALLEAGHEVVCCVRDRRRLPIDHLLADHQDKISIWEVDFLEEPTGSPPGHIDVAYYLIHSLSSSIGGFAEQERRTARHFRAYLDRTEARQIIYLSGIANEEELSQHLASRRAVEDELREAKAQLTVLRAAIIIGSGSASFEIIRDLVEKLPVMITPRWLLTRCQPLAVGNAIAFLHGVAGREDCYDEVYDIGGPDQLTYKDMLLGYARVRKLQRWIGVVPVMTPRLSSYWLYFVTSTTYPLAVNLVDSMKVEVLARPNDLAQRLGISLLGYEQSIERAFQKIEQQTVVSSWKDALITSSHRSNLQRFFRVPKHGVFNDRRSRLIPDEEVDRVMENIWSIGGRRGWYYGDQLWRIRGWLDKFVGGVGLRRGRTHDRELHPGDALDFWRVLAADREERRLLLLAEMKLPGEAWLEFSLQPSEKEGYHCLQQVATFRPLGVMGRLYWWLVLPFHAFVFPGMLRNIIAYQE